MKTGNKHPVKGYILFLTRVGQFVKASLDSGEEGIRLERPGGLEASRILGLQISTNGTTINSLIILKALFYKIAPNFAFSKGGIIFLFRGKR